jgi:hypothetical protein
MSNVNYTQRDKERILRYKHLLSFTTRAFFEDYAIVVMDSFLHHYFTNFLVETDDLKDSTCLPRELIREALYSFQKSRLIKSLLAN